MISADDTTDAEELVVNDPGVQKLLRERYGITDMSMVAADPWYYGDRYGEALRTAGQGCLYRLHCFQQLICVVESP